MEGLVGGISSAVGLGIQAYSAYQQNKFQKTMYSDWKRDQEELKTELKQEKDQARIMSYPTSGRDMGGYYGMGGSIRKYGMGGSINDDMQPVASDVAVAEGGTHEQGGVDYGSNELEGDEVVLSLQGQDLVFSNRIPFQNKGSIASIAKQLGTMKGLLEKKTGSRGVGIQAQGTNNRIKQQIDDVDAKLMSLYQYQETYKEANGLKNPQDEQQAPPQQEMKYGGSIRKYPYGGSMYKIFGDNINNYNKKYPFGKEAIAPVTTNTDFYNTPAEKENETNYSEAADYVKDSILENNKTNPKYQWGYREFVDNPKPSTPPINTTSKSTLATPTTSVTTPSVSNIPAYDFRKQTKGIPALDATKFVKRLGQTLLSQKSVKENDAAIKAAEDKFYTNNQVSNPENDKKVSATEEKFYNKAGDVLDTASAYAPFINNLITMRNRPKPQKPLLNTALTLDPYVNIEGQKANMNTQTDIARKAISNSTSNSNIASSRMGAITANNITAMNDLHTSKDNAERGIRNVNIQNAQGVLNANNSKVEGYNNDVYNHIMNVQRDYSNINANVGETTRRITRDNNLEKLDNRKMDLIDKAHSNGNDAVAMRLFEEQYNRGAYDNMSDEELKAMPKYLKRLYSNKTGKKLD